MTNTIWIPGIPAPQGSKRHVGNGILIESSKRVGPWRAVVALTVGEQTTTVLDGPVRIELQFVMPRPKATPKRSLLHPHPGDTMTDQTQTIPSHLVYTALRTMRIDPYGVVDVHIGTEFVTVTRHQSGGPNVFSDYPIDRKGLG